MKYFLYSIIFSIIGIIIGGSIWFVSKPIPISLQGEVVARQIVVSPRIIGKLEAMYVEEGEQVKKGQVLAKIDAPSINAKAYQAEAALKAADAQKDKVFAGARHEEIYALLNQYEKALVAEDLAKKTYLRVNSLYKDGVIAAQQNDEAYTKWQASLNDVKSAKAKYEIAKKGARIEDKNAAVAMTEQATGAVREVQSFLDDTILTSPIDGEIMNIVAETGELVTAGFPVITLVDMNDIWITFNIREDLLKNINIGTIINVMMPAISDSEVFPVEVRYISKVGDFAVWSATKTSGQFDLKTFEVRAYPVNKINGLRSGMTAVFYLNK